MNSGAPPGPYSKRGRKELTMDQLGITMLWTYRNERELARTEVAYPPSSSRTSAAILAAISSRIARTSSSGRPAGSCRSQST